MTVKLAGLLKGGVAVLALQVLAACTTPDPTVTLPEITFQHAQPINLDVARVEVAEAYRSPLASPHVEHKMETTPARGLKVWARDRLKAVGGPGSPLTARLTIEKAAVTQSELQRTKGIKGAFTTDQEYRYDLEVAATLEIVDQAGQRLGHAQARATQSQTTPEDATLADLHKTWFKLLEKGLRDFDQEMERNMRRFLARWIR